MLQRRVIFIDKYGYFLPSLFVGCHNNGIKTIGKFCCFTEFWCSDDTDPFERIYIQWSLSKFFPAKTMGSHVTNWNKNTSVKFRTDVCSSCKLGFDIDLKSLSPDEYKFVQNAVKNYDEMKPMILEGDQYRLVSPYEGNHCAINYVSKDKQYSGDYLMKIGLNVFSQNDGVSHVLVLE